MADPLYLAVTNTSDETTRLDIVNGDPPDPGVLVTTRTARDTLRVHSEHGNAVYATCNHDDETRAAVAAYGTHMGVYAQINGPGAPAVMGQGVGDGSRGVFGWGTGTAGIGVHGVATDGVGGVFEGSKANITLRPMQDAATHPDPGTVGDLLVDQTGRLWYCQASGNPGMWIQLA